MKRLAPALALAVILACAGTARADVYDDNPAAASRGPGDMTVLVRGAGGAIYERHLAGGAWTPWASLGGETSSGPALAAYEGDLHAFVVGADLAVYENVLKGRDWSGWRSLGGVASSAPAAVARLGTPYLDLAVRGTDNAIHHKAYVPGSGWTGWANLGGNLTSAPSLNSQDPGVLNVWARGADGQLVQKAWDGSAWREWAALGGSLLGAPAAYSRMQNLVDVFVRGVDSALYQRSWTGATGWLDWGRVDPSAIDSAPAAVADEPGHLAIFARKDANLVAKVFQGGVGWGPWTDFGPVALPAPPPPPAADGLAKLSTGDRCTPPGGRIKVSLKIRKRTGKARPRVRKVVFFVKRGPRRADRRRPYVRRLPLHRPAGTTGRVYARAVYTRKGSRRLHRKTVSKRFVMCG